MINHKFTIAEQIVKYMESLTNSCNSERDWELVYDLIFCKYVHGKWFETFPNFKYYDPDASYQEDVVAFYMACAEHLKEMEKFNETKI